MSECPKCGAKESGRASNGIVYECFSGHLDGEWTDGVPCLRRQLDQANERLTALLSERMDESEAKIGTRPAHVVVEELQAENERLREALQDARDTIELIYPSSGYSDVPETTLAKIDALIGGQGGDTDGMA